MIYWAVIIGIDGGYQRGGDGRLRVKLWSTFLPGPSKESMPKMYSWADKDNEVLWKKRKETIGPTGALKVPLYEPSCAAKGLQDA